MTDERLTPHTPLEISPKEEVLIPVPDVLTISGYSGVGKTTVAYILKRLFHMRFEKTGGEKFREWYEKTTGQKVLGFADRDPSVDIALDDYTSLRIKQTIKTGRKVIVEARLGGWLAKKVENAQASQREPREEKPRQTFRVLLRASEGYRITRLRRRINEEREKADLPPLSFTQVARSTREREQKDLAIWRRAHPELLNIDPLSEENRDENGEPIYNLIVNTDNLSVVGVADKIYRELQARGLLMRVLQEEKKSPQQQLPPSGTIFKAP